MAPPDDMFDAADVLPPPSGGRPASEAADFGGDASALGPTPGSDGGGLADLAPLPTPGDSLGCGSGLLSRPAVAAGAGAASAVTAAALLSGSHAPRTLQLTS